MGHLSYRNHVYKLSEDRANKKIFQKFPSQRAAAIVAGQRKAIKKSNLK